MVIGILLVAVSTAGCELLFPGFSEEYPAPSAIATYTKGSATLTLEDGTKVVLDKLSTGPHLWSVFGSDARWSGSGWHLRVGGAGDAAEYMSPQVTFDRIVDGEHWTTYSFEACDVEIAVASATALRGAASCEDLRWSDALGGMDPLGAAQPPYIPDQPRFDVTVSFEATR